MLIGSLHITIYIISQFALATFSVQVSISWSLVTGPQPEAENDEPLNQAADT